MLDQGVRTVCAQPINPVALFARSVKIELNKVEYNFESRWYTGVF